ncbi:hypothetical protein [Larsenimonas rhizosphaerae]|uniref:Lipoprotein n=1 Tax=Larsenimonas rhizosphaerae TaxID=2944682 RepID=A0AA41ZF87_9GAMM|nr:hypothetical protein [Larsenimonas rhizosphaerae]MCM2130374.1 hypothetical protein [Larsenimonas rhizosphaerae]MCX2523079.1 hypothetical protein [Larsenimonas rhizosphaerae]
MSTLTERRRYQGFAVVFMTTTLLLSGCSTMSWSKPQADHQDLVMDSQDCRGQKDALTNNGRLENDYGVGLHFSTLSGFSTSFYTEPAEYRVDNCMSARGWTLTPHG